MFKTQLYIVVVFLIFATFFQIPDLSQYDSKRILQLFVLTFIGVLFVFSTVRKTVLPADNSLLKNITGSKITFITVAVLFVTGLISVCLSSNYQYALLEFSFLFLLFALIFAIPTSTLKKHYFLGRLTIVTALIFSALYTTIFLGNYISSFFDPMIAQWPQKHNFLIIVDGIEVAGKEILYFDHKRYFNHTQTWTLPLLLGTITYIRQKEWDLSIQGTLFILTSFWWMLLIATGGRGTAFGVIVSLLLLLAIFRSELIKLLKVTLSTLLFGWLLHVVLFSFSSGGTSQNILRTESSRFYRWEGALEVWWQNPLFGLGPMHYAKIGDSQFVGHPHNFYLQFLSEWGIFAFIALVILLVVCTKFVLINGINTKKHSPNRTIYLTFTWTILAAFIHAFFSGVMMTPMSQMWFVLIAAWFIGYNRRETSISNKWSLNLEYVKITYLILLIVVVFLVYDDALNLANRYSEYFDKFPNTNVYPRFWGQGLF